MGRVLLCVWLITIAQVMLLRSVDPPFTMMMAWEWLWGEERDFSVSLRHGWRPLGKLSPHLRKAVLAGEDQRFLSHHGFDFTEMGEAFRDILAGGRTRGASTITMQVARTVFLWPERSWLRKLAEAYYTVLIEVFCSKQRILELYLNTVDWGRGIMGGEAASRAYFHVSADGLSRHQAALLAAILPNPHGWSPTHPNWIVLRRQARILKDMEKMPLVSESI